MNIGDECNIDTEEEFIFNEYSVDDTLDPLSRLQRYHNSDFSLQRLVLANDLSDTARSTGFEEAAQVLLPIAKVFLSDAEPSVRQAFVKQLVPLSTFFVEEGGATGYSIMTKTFLPYAFALLVDKNNDVGSTAMATISGLADLVQQDDVENELLAVVISLSQDERSEDYRVVAAQLFNRLAKRFGKDVCETTILQQLRLLSSDASFTVRKALGAHLGEISVVLGSEQATETILPIFLALCRDEVWGVRKACAENIVDVSRGVTRDARAQQMVPVIRALTSDTSRWVRNASYQVLGQFINTMQPDDISPLLLKLFTDMAYQSEGGDNEFSEFCAYALPGVVQVTGPERWSDIEDAYATMLKDSQWKVRKTLAHSIHEIALILGQEITEKSLLDPFSALIRDLDDIKFGVVRGSDKFLSVCQPATREFLAPMVCNVLLNSENWRLRSDIAERIGHIAELLPPDSRAMEDIVSMVKRLLDDSVSKVRQSTFRPAAQTLKHLAESGKESEYEYLQYIIALADSPSFYSRQIFVYVVQQVAELESASLVERYFLERLVALSHDTVSNVRVVVARVLEKTFLVRPQWKTNKSVIQIANILRESKDME